LAKRNRVEETLHQLSLLGREARSEQARRELEAALADRSNLVVARAAKIVADAGLHALTPRLEEAFARLMPGAAATDKTCAAKIEIVRALMKLGVPADDTYLQAVRHRQPEKAYGEPVDTAAELRAQAAVAMAETASPLALEVAAELLADNEVPARVGAVRALVASSSQASALLLRYKALAGDPESEVLSECFSGLLAISRDTLPFVARFLNDPREDVASLAALAIGQSRLAGSSELLKQAFASRPGLEFRKAVLLGVSMARGDDSFEFLLSVIRDSAPLLAVEALTSAVAYVIDQRTEGAVEEAVRDNGSRSVRDAFMALYGGRA
jgi:hypothetical protein